MIYEYFPRQVLKDKTLTDATKAVSKSLFLLFYKVKYTTQKT